MLVPIKNYTLTPLKIIPSVNFTNFAFAVGLCSLESNCSIIEKIPPKGESFSDFIATFTMSVGFDTYFDLQH